MEKNYLLQSRAGRGSSLLRVRGRVPPPEDAQDEHPEILHEEQDGHDDLNDQRVSVVLLHGYVFVEGVRDERGEASDHAGHSYELAEMVGRERGLNVHEDLAGEERHVHDERNDGDVACGVQHLREGEGIHEHAEGIHDHQHFDDAYHVCELPQDDAGNEGERQKNLHDCYHFRTQHPTRRLLVVRARPADDDEVEGNQEVTQGEELPPERRGPQLLEEHLEPPLERNLS